MYCASAEPTKNIYHCAARWYDNGVVVACPSSGKYVLGNLGHSIARKVVEHGKEDGAYVELGALSRGW